MSITETEKGNRIIMGIMIILWVLLITYMGTVAYFTNRFYFGSEINGINVSGKTVEETKEQMASKLQSYRLNLKERGGKEEEIRGPDINLKYNPSRSYKEFKDKQNPYRWVLAPFDKEESKMAEELSYDNRLLKEKIDKLPCFNSSNVVEPKNPSFKYEDKGYVIISEVNGNKVDKDILYRQIVKAISKEETSIDLETTDCYVRPKYTSKSPEIIKVKDILNKYVSSKITYVFGESKETIAGSEINKWLKINENLEITVDEEKVRTSLEEIFSAYNTVGKLRNFVTSSGKTIDIDGGDYGWSINIAKEIQDLNTIIKEGQTITKEPTYSQTALSHNKNGIGNTYVEIDMTNQHLWFYKNGSLVVQGDIVTGNISSNHGTPKGIYRLKYKQADTVLRGQDYSSPVSFWMPFNGGIGIHDANWRGAFGGNIYRTNGSHGCVNCPYYLAREIFYNIQAGSPVICYY
ncbi:L,D-transpeptidase/peptidoglycan binding protein [Clostridium sp. CX1]|uniref:L,D-transpeptidase family protein n=1 Tax=Clostridium sp. CX1 TaxID=2978346 RepID=UPI0021C2065E|nr:L,D-transpeptidase family protein [Clostridium sp. CX1]MCT8975913.1 L,D-transpeptidase/peptidoglycan binding protein [Clostridium sp. CX1]